MGIFCFWYLCSRSRQYEEPYPIPFKDQYNAAVGAMSFFGLFYVPEEESMRRLSEME